MSTKVYDNMVLVPEHEYISLKEKNNLASQKHKKKVYHNVSSKDNIPSSLPGILPEDLPTQKTSKSNKEDISTNWVLVWEAL